MSTVTISIVGHDAASPAFTAASKSLHTIATQSDAVSASLKKQELQMSSTQKQLVAMRGGLDASASALGKLALPFAAVGAASVKMAADFDSSLHNINSIAGLSQAEMGKLGQSFVDLSLDASKTFEGASALADGFYDIQSAGFAGAEGMKVLEASTKAASAGMSTTKTAAGAISAVLNAYGQSADEAAHVSDVLFQTVNLGVVNFEELSSSIGRVIPVAASAKIPIEEVGAAISTMTKSGLDGARAVTDLTSLINSVVKPSTDASKAAAQMGLDFSFAALQSKGLAGFMHDVMVATGGNAEAMGKLFSSQEALTAALSLTKGGMQGFTSDLNGMNAAAGKTDAAFQEMSKSTTAQFQRLKANFEALGITVGSALLPRVNDVVASVNSLVVAFTKLPANEQQRWINIATAIGGTTVAVYALTKATQGLIAAWEAGTAVFAGVRAAAALIGGTLGPLVVPLAAVAGGTVYLLKTAHDYSTELDNQAQALTEHNTLMTGAAAVQERFAASLIASTPAGQAQIDTLKQLQSEHANLQRQIVEQSNLSTPFGVNEELERLKGLLKDNETAIDATTTHMDAMTSSTERAKQALTEQATAIHNTGSAFQTAGEASRSLTAGLDAANAATALTIDQMKALEQAAQQATTEGIGALGDMLTTTAKSYDSIADLTTEHWKKIAAIDSELHGKITAARKAELEQQRADESASYQVALEQQLEAEGEQLAAEKAHLGTMLMAYVDASGITGQRAEELKNKIGETFGVLPDLATETFGSMRQTIDNWAHDTSISNDSVTASLKTTANTAIDTRTEMEKLAKKYTLELEHNLEAGKISAEEFVTEVGKIPARVKTEIDTNAVAAAADVAGVKTQLDLIDRHPVIHFTVTSDGAPQGTGSGYSGQAPKRPPPGVVGGIHGQALGGMDLYTSADSSSLHQSMDSFVADAAYVIQKIADIAKTYTTEGIKAATDYADAAGRIFSAIGAGVTAFRGLADYKGVIPGMLDWLGADMITVTNKMIDVANHLDKDGVAAAAVFAEAESKIVAPIGSAVENFKTINAYQGVMPNILDWLGADTRLVVEKMIDIAGNLDKDGVAAAATFAEKENVIAGAVKTAVEAFSTINDYAGVAPDHLQLLVNDSIEITKMTGDMSYQAGAAASGALDWQNHLEAYATRIKAGLNSIASLDGLTATATIHAQTSIVYDSGSPSNNGTPSNPGAPTPPPPTQPGQPPYSPRAGGGPVYAGQSYLIGERGPEMFYPYVSGSIASNGAPGSTTARLPASDLVPLILAMKEIMTQHAYDVVRALYDTKPAETGDYGIQIVMAGA